jgi:hypothetical protein
VGGEFAFQLQVLEIMIRWQGSHSCSRWSHWPWLWLFPSYSMVRGRRPSPPREWAIPKK